ncbi:hypothetical protein LY76DRAFT_250987 [Colletotrichum caudatum]|nr:hypothetical protein LY76DRAFT_250987 [Colletotrichum caudatum]
MRKKKSSTRKIKTEPNASTLLLFGAVQGRGERVEIRLMSFLSWVQGVVAKLVCCLLHERKIDSLRCAIVCPNPIQTIPEGRKESREKRAAKIAVFVMSSSSENIGYPLSPVLAPSLDLSGVDQARIIQMLTFSVVRMCVCVCMRVCVSIAV